MKLKLINMCLKIILIVIVFFGCTATNPNYNTWDYIAYIASDYKNTLEWRETEDILAKLDTPEKVAVWMSKNFKFYDFGFRMRNYGRLETMKFLKEAVPPPSRFVKTGGATCITAANFARIALEKSGHDAIILRLHNGNLKSATRSIGTGDAQIHFVCLVQYQGALYSVGDTWGPQSHRLISTGKIQGPWNSIDDFVINYIGKFKNSRWKILTEQIPAYDHLPEKEKCRGVSCD